MASTAASSGSGQTVKVSDLQIPQLQQLKQQLDEEISHLSTSYNQLRSAQVKFKECISSLEKGLADVNTDKAILVPLTSSLYVPGKLADTETVIVDVGTGYYVEKSRDDAKVFYQAKVKELGENLGKLEGVVRQKTESLQVIEDALRQKLLQQQSGASNPNGKGA